jgi:serine/threonine protein kinase
MPSDAATSLTLNCMCLSTRIVSNAEEINSLYKEANSLMKLRHKNIIDLHHAFVEGKQLIMIMELASGGELTDYVSKKGRLEETEAR